MAVRTARSRLHMIAPLKIALAVTLFQKISSTLQSVPPRARWRAGRACEYRHLEGGFKRPSMAVFAKSPRTCLKISPTLPPLLPELDEAVFVPPLLLVADTVL